MTGETFLGLMTELLLERELAGGKLSLEVESDYVARLDALWWKLTDEQQDALEAEINRTPGAPLSLGLQDVEVSPGCRHIPRSRV